MEMARQQLMDGTITLTKQKPFSNCQQNEIAVLSDPCFCRGHFSNTELLSKGTDRFYELPWFIHA